MAKTVLIDSGVIVAAIIRGDQFHAWSRAQLEAMDEPCLTCEAVVSESFFLLQRDGGGRVEAICELLERGIILTPFSLEEHLDESIRLIRKYRDIPMSFADACLVRMSEIYPDATVLTTDSDFKLYRKNNRQRISAISP